MAEFATPATSGVDHVGLSVRDLESTRRFFCDCLGWRVVGERLEYPAAFVSDGQQIVTLWRVEAPDQATSFGSCVQAHHGAIYQFAMAHAPPATTVSSGGEEPEYGTGLWTHLPPLMMRPSK